MSRAIVAAFGVSRLAFGASLLVEPERLGALLLGKKARNPAVRVSLRGYGTRDVVVGGGMLLAAVTGGSGRGWIAAAVASDALDAALQLAEWDDLPAGRREAGLAAAVGAGLFGAALLAAGDRADAAD